MSSRFQTNPKVARKVNQGLSRSGLERRENTEVEESPQCSLKRDEGGLHKLTHYTVFHI
jgi:hypothetical protein